tara:strand:+ start:24626 stop:25030 length:405 start_codon:yes stop_codon:yes gene_type:complete
MSSSDTATIMAELAALRGEVETLRAEVASHRNASRTSLKEHHRCPQCQGTSVLHCAEIRDHNHGGGHMPMSIQTSGTFRLRTEGDFEVYICRNCELAEWYLKGARDIVPEKLDKKNRKLVRIIENANLDNGPFR